MLEFCVSSKYYKIEYCISCDEEKCGRPFIKFKAMDWGLGEDITLDNVDVRTIGKILDVLKEKEEVFKEFVRTIVAYEMEAK